jgi:hypothetical protein
MKNEVFDANLEKPIDLKIEFGPDQEIERINKTIERLPWFREKGYTSIRLPKVLSEKSSREEVEAAVNLEFDGALYEDFSRYLQGCWDEVSLGLKKLQEIEGFKLKDEYSIQLTKYGTGGSYDSEKGKVVEHLIRKYNVKHWYKERFVDLIGERNFPGVRNLQNIKEDTSIVDEAFNSFFPNIDALVKAVGDDKH